MAASRGQPALDTASGFYGWITRGGIVKLTDKQRAFCEHYLTHWNATQAAIEAGYSKNSARQMASENLSKPYIAAYIEKRMSEMAMSANEVLHRLGQQARLGIGLFIDQAGRLDIKQVKKYGHLVKSLTWTKYGPKIELHDAQSALVHLGRHYKLFTDRIELDGWQKELLDLLESGSITPEDIESELGSDVAKEFFEQAGIHFAGIGATEAKGATDTDELA